MSYVNSQSRHERLNFESIQAFKRVAHWVSEDTPIILETPVDSDEVEEELTAARQVFARKHQNLQRKISEHVSGLSAQQISANTGEVE
jgi:hypothetical protein